MVGIGSVIKHPFVIKLWMAADSNSAKLSANNQSYYSVPLGMALGFLLGIVPLFFDTCMTE